MTSSQQPSFDRIARLYRWLEYLTFGRALERCRLHFIPQLADCQRALVLGDGDGRFLACLLAKKPLLTADAVDTSAAMLRLLLRRCEPNFARLRIRHADALAFTSTLASEHTYDLIVTHFFLDCLSQSQVDALAAGLIPHLRPSALWLVSDFRIPTGPMHHPVRMLVRSLYLAFRILTGLRTRHLPDHAAALTRVGLTRVARHYSLFGLLITELWSIRTEGEANRPPHQTSNHQAPRGPVPLR